MGRQAPGRNETACAHQDDAGGLKTRLEELRTLITDKLVELERGCELGHRGRASGGQAEPVAQSFTIGSRAADDDRGLWDLSNGRSGLQPISPQPLEEAMKYLTALAPALSVIVALTGSASAKSVWDQISQTAPRSGVFEDLSLTAPKSVFETLNETAPRSDGVYGELEKNAP